MLERWLTTSLFIKILKIGKSLIEKNTKDIIGDIYKEAKINNCEILLPEDCIVGTDFDGVGKNKNHRSKR